MLNKLFKKIGKKQDNDVDDDVAQLKRSNNKCFTSTFSNIQIRMKQHKIQFIYKFNKIVLDST